MVRALAGPDTLLVTLEERMTSLAEQERFEEAALARDRLRALAEALWRSRVDRWLTAGRLVLSTEEGGRLIVEGGSLEVEDPSASLPSITCPPPRHRADELAALRSWICRHRLSVEACDVAPSEPVRGGRELARLLQLVRGASDPGRRGTRR